MVGKAPLADRTLEFEHAADGMAGLYCEPVSALYA